MGGSSVNASLAWSILILNALVEGRYSHPRPYFSALLQMSEKTFPTGTSLNGAQQHKFSFIILSILACLMSDP